MLLPTILMFLIYVFLYWGDIEKLSYCAFGEYKFGYWFTFVLFQMNLLHWGVAALMGSVTKDERKVKGRILVGLTMSAVLLVVLKDWDWNHNEARLANWFSLRLLAMFFPFYVIGMICRYDEMRFHRIVNNECMVGVAFVAFVLCLIHQGGGFYFSVLQECLGVFLLYRFCYRYQGVFSDKTFIGRQLSLIGRNTLSIYLIHYFFFLGLKLPMVGASLDAQTQWCIVFCIALALTIAVAYGSLAIAKLFGISKPLSKMLIGK